MATNKAEKRMCFPCQATEKYRRRPKQETGSPEWSSTLRPPIWAQVMGDIEKRWKGSKRKFRWHDTNTSSDVRESQASRKRKLQEGKDVLKRDQLTKWQRQLKDTMDKAQWGKLIIGNIINWYKCEHSQLDYYKSQILTGHECFMSYSKKICKTEVDIYIYPAHTIFYCHRWEIQRQKREMQQVQF